MKPDITNWEKLGEEIVFDEYRRLLKRTYKTPDGKIKDFTVKVEGAPVCILAITTDNQVLLAKQYRQGPEKVLLELPGGGKDDGETPLEAAKRELLEETGYTGDFEFIGTSLRCAYSTGTRNHFVATNCIKVQEPENDEHEFIEIVTMTIQEFKKHILTGELSDEKTAYRGLIHLGII